MTTFLRDFWDGHKLRLLTACYTLTVVANVIISWTLYARRYVILIIPILSIFMLIGSLVVLFFVLLWRFKGRQVSPFEAEEARIARICRSFWRVTEEDLVAATANFSHRKIIGKGSFGTVYRGILSNGQVVAIKRMRSTPFAENHFLSELHILGQLRHRNLLRILGYFHNCQEMALLTKFMPNLSLHILLHSPQECRLNWRQRLKIAVGVAYGLEYLHHGLRNTIVHRDLKPANILLDEDLEPHIADFGLAEVINDNQRTQSSSRSRPSFTFTVGYTAPERAYVGMKTSPKFDVYSYGILLLELISGLKPTDSRLIEMGVTISQWARNAEAENNCIELMDSWLRSDSEFHTEIQRVIRIAIHCTHESPQMRPAMKDVVKGLGDITGKRQWNTPLYVLQHQEMQHDDSHLTGDSSS